MKQAIRHGDILLVKTKSIPKLKASKEKVIEKGSHGHPHSIDNGKIYFHKDGDFIIGYLEAKNTKLFHPEHSPKGAEIEDGFYEIRKQSEFTPDGLVPVID